MPQDLADFGDEPSGGCVCWASKKFYQNQIDSCFNVKTIESSLDLLLQSHKIEF